VANAPRADEPLALEERNEDLGALALAIAQGDLSRVGARRNRRPRSGQTPS